LDARRPSFASPPTGVALSRSMIYRSADMQTCIQPAHRSSIRHGQPIRSYSSFAGAPRARGASGHAGCPDPRAPAEWQDDVGALGGREARLPLLLVRRGRGARRSGTRPRGIRRRTTGPRNSRRGAARARAVHGAQGLCRPRRVPGRFILTGSANVLLIPSLADSLAGRMGILRLHPLAQCELAGSRPRFLDALFRGSFRTGLAEPLGTTLAARIVGGGYPAALAP